MPAERAKLGCLHVMSILSAESWQKAEAVLAPQAIKKVCKALCSSPPHQLFQTQTIACDRDQAGNRGGEELACKTIRFESALVPRGLFYFLPAGSGKEGKIT